MTPREFRDTRLALGLSVEQLAERLGVDPGRCVGGRTATGRFRGRSLSPYGS